MLRGGKARSKTVDDRLLKIAISAIANCEGNMHRAVEDVWGRVSKDRILLVALFGPSYRIAVSQLLGHARSVISNYQRDGKLRGPTDRGAAFVIANLKVLDEIDQQADEKSIQEARAREASDYADRLAIAWKRTAIGSYHVDGVPVWRVTPREAKREAKLAHKRWTIIEMLCEGLPDDDQPIDYYRKPEDVAKAWRQLWKTAIVS